MPLKLIPPREGKTPYFYIRGTHLGVSLNCSTGASDRTLARQILKKKEREIERGAVSDKPAVTFAMAAQAYINNGGERRFLKPLATYLGNVALADLDQAAIDAAALRLYPKATPATRNRQVYTPVSAVFKHVGAETPLRRPKGSRGNKRVDWLEPEDAERLFRAAIAIDEEFGIFLVLLCYTGLRLSEALKLEIRNINLASEMAYLPDSKNGEDRAVFLPPIVVAMLARHPQGLDRKGCIFRFRKNGRLYALLKATKRAAGTDLLWPTFHSFRHTYATWMRRYGGLDTRGLVGTGAWKDETSAARYAHTVPSEDSRKALLLPSPKLK